MSYPTRWALFCLVVAVVPWIVAVWIGRLRRVTLAQVGLMIGVLGFGLAARGLDLNLFYVLMLVLVGSALVADMTGSRP